MEARLACARALARQWFGVWLRPRAPADEWLLEGLAGYLEDVYVRRFMGRNELLYRCGPRGAARRARGPLPWACSGAYAASGRPCTLSLSCRGARARGRRAKEREAVWLADDGAAPPLYMRGPSYPWGALHATGELGPGASLRRWKARPIPDARQRAAPRRRSRAQPPGTAPCAAASCRACSRPEQTGQHEGRGRLGSQRIE
jgi:hypothetical protein